MRLEESVTWQQSRAMTEELLDRLLPITPENIAALDGREGVYVVTYEGRELGFGLWSGPNPKVIYVGISKPNSSRHFQSGNTGTSTLRRSLGALLQHQLELTAVPRCQDPADSDRYSNYAFDLASEERLSAWMAKSFQIAFLPLEKGKAEAVQVAMIDYNAPLFNFQNNPANKYGAEIKVYRKKCAEEAKLADLRIASV
jgi:hypothetical protein